VDDAPAPPCYRLAALTAAAGLHRAWLARSGLAARSQRTYLQQAASYLAWLDVQPALAASLDVPAAPGPWCPAIAEAAMAAMAARQNVANRAAARYQRHLAGNGAAAASVKLALAAIGSLHRAVGLEPPQVPGRASTRPYERPRTLSGQELALVQAAAAARSPRDRALAALADEAGLRPAEIVALDVDDIAAEAVRVRDSWHPHRDRAVPLAGAETREALQAWLAERAELRCAGRALFIARGGKRISLRTVEHVLGLLGSASGLRVSPRTLRNTRTAALADAGVTLHAATRFLGHARPETLRPYATGVPEDPAAQVRHPASQGPGAPG
jgi:site-specific recombinase XerC